MFKKKRENEYKNEVAKNMDLAVAMKWQPPSRVAIATESNGYHYVDDNYNDLIEQLEYCMKSKDPFDNTYLQVMIAGSGDEEMITLRIDKITAIIKFRSNE